MEWWWFCNVIQCWWPNIEQERKGPHGQIEADQDERKTEQARRWLQTSFLFTFFIEEIEGPFLLRNRKLDSNPNFQF